MTKLHKYKFLDYSQKCVENERLFRKSGEKNCFSEAENLVG